MHHIALYYFTRTDYFVGNYFPRHNKISISKEFRKGL